MSLTLLTPPRQEPVSLERAKLHLRVSLPDDDDLIQGYIAAARHYLETVTARTFLTTTWVLGLDGFTPHPWQRCGGIPLPRPPLQRVTGITYLDSAGATQALSYTDGTGLHLPSPAVYRVDTLSEPGQVVLLPAGSWPSAYGSVNAVQITYVAGYPTPTVLFQHHASLLSLLLLLVGEMYEYREATVDKAVMRRQDAINDLLWINRLIQVS